MDNQSEQPIRFAGSVLGAQRHVCAFFQMMHIYAMATSIKIECLL